METTARLFFALWPPAHTRVALANWAKAMQPLCGGRITASASIHLTLAFLGDVPTSEIATLQELIERLDLPCSFHLGLDRASVWPHNGIAHATASAVAPQLAGLAHVLVDALRAQGGLRTEERTFVPHVTLLRRAHVPNAPLPQRKVDWEVDRVVLLRSRPLAHASHYETIAVRRLRV